MHLSEPELYEMILGALSHSPSNPFPWLFSVISFIACCAVPWCNGRLNRILAALLAGGLFLGITTHFANRSSENDARILAKILASETYQVSAVDDGEEVDVRIWDASQKINIGISHAEKIDSILKHQGVPFLPWQGGQK